MSIEKFPKEGEVMLTFPLLDGLAKIQVDLYQVNHKLYVGSVFLPFLRQAEVQDIAELQWLVVGKESQKPVPPIVLRWDLNEKLDLIACVPEKPRSYIEQCDDKAEFAICPWPKPQALNEAKDFFKSITDSIIYVPMYSYEDFLAMLSTTEGLNEEDQLFCYAEHLRLVRTNLLAARLTNRDVRVKFAKHDQIQNYADENWISLNQQLTWDMAVFSQSEMPSVVWTSTGFCSPDLIRDAQIIMYGHYLNVIDVADLIVFSDTEPIVRESVLLNPTNENAHNDAITFLKLLAERKYKLTSVDIDPHPHCFSSAIA